MLYGDPRGLFSDKISLSNHRGCGKIEASKGMVGRLAIKLRLKIVHKLFLALLVTSGAVLVVMALLMQINLDRGFLDYLNEIEVARHDRLILALKQRYLVWGSWEPLDHDHRVWRLMLASSRGVSEEELERRDALNRRPPRRDGPGPRNRSGNEQNQNDFEDGPPSRRDGRRPPPRRRDGGDDDYGAPPRREDRRNEDGRNDEFGPPSRRDDGDNSRGQYGDDSRRGPPPRDRPGGPPGPPPGGGRESSLDPRLTLYDVDKQPIIGEGPPPPQVTLRNIELDGDLIGFLGIAPLKEISEDRDLAFIQTQSRFFYVVTAVLIALAALVSMFLARNLLRRLTGLANATHRLSAGDYKVRVPAVRHDEIGLLARDFNNLALALERNEEARRRWTADISHELRTPLSVLRGEVEAIQDGVHQASPETLDSLHGEVLGISKLVDDLYQLSLSDIGALNYKKVLLNPLTLFKGIANTFQTRFSERGIELECDLPNLPQAEILADPDRLRQLITNLLENSCRYTDPGGCHRISAEIANDHLVVRFQDSEPGVDEELCARLFERHFRTQESGAREKRGAGLGLAICKNIVEAHDGTLEASPSQMGGLCFTLILPITR